MSLVYYYGMGNKTFSLEQSRKTVIFMLKSMKYLVKQAKLILVTWIYRFAFTIIGPI